VSEASVVVASFRAPALLEACLDSIEVARRGRVLPVVVARRAPADPVRPLIEGREGVSLLEVAGDADVPRLRGAGLAAATSGAWVALTEDHCVAAPDWLDRLLAEPPPGAAAMGGAMGNRRPTVVDWGAYFSEYGFFGAGARAHDPPLLTGANVAYARAVVPDVAAWAGAGAWENVVHDRLHAGGGRLVFRPDALVLQNATYELAAFCRDRYEHGLAFARARLDEGPGAPRALLLAGAPLLPALLGARVARATAPRDRMAFLRALPFTLAFLGAWATGEVVGYLRGPATRE
jgi:hypothetical protein